jgi:hypothetical protein
LQGLYGLARDLLHLLQVKPDDVSDREKNCSVCVTQTNGKTGTQKSWYCFEPESLLRDFERREINVISSLQRIVNTLTKRTKTNNDTDRTAK